MIKEDLDPYRSLSGDSIDWALFGGGCAPLVTIVKMPRTLTATAPLMKMVTMSIMKTKPYAPHFFQGVYYWPEAVS